MYDTVSYLIFAIKNNDEKALKSFYKRNFKKVEAYILHNNGTQEDAKDIYQEAFISVWRNIQTDKFAAQGESSLDGYLYRIAQNKWLDHLRSSSRKNHFIQQDEVHILSSEPEDIIEQKNELERMIAQLKSSFLELGQNCKELLTGFYYEKKALKTIAAQFGWTEATAKNNKYRCLQKLRDIVNNKTNGQS